MALAQTFTDGGFSNALIQKKTEMKPDYSTVFYFNITVGIFLALIFFFSSTLISDFYNIAKLKLVIQVMSINLIILSFQVVQNLINIDFKIRQKLIGVCGSSWELF